MIDNADFTDFQPILAYLTSVPYNVSRLKLYTSDELYAGYTPDKPESYDNCYDTQIYRHYLATRKQVLAKFQQKVETSPEKFNLQTV